MVDRFIRWAEGDDAPAIAALYAANVVNSAISFEVDAPDADEMRRRMTRVQATAPWLVCEHAGRVIGYSYAARHRERAAYQWCLDSSIFVDRAHHRTGIGRALYRALFALVQLQGYCAIHAGVTLPNPASIRLHESLGFQPVGVYPRVGWKLGAWHDVGWWQLELRPRDAAPTCLLTPRDARSQDPVAWAAALASQTSSGPTPP